MSAAYSAAGSLLMNQVTVGQRTRDQFKAAGTRALAKKLACGLVRAVQSDKPGHSTQRLVICPREGSGGNVPAIG